jgi:hypothetical protein
VRGCHCRPSSTFLTASFFRPLLRPGNRNTAERRCFGVLPRGWEQRICRSEAEALGRRRRSSRSTRRVKGAGTREPLSTDPEFRERLHLPSRASHSGYPVPGARGNQSHACTVSTTCRQRPLEGKVPSATYLQLRGRFRAREAQPTIAHPCRRSWCSSRAPRGARASSHRHRSLASF